PLPRLFAGTREDFPQRAEIDGLDEMPIEAGCFRPLPIRFLTPARHGDDLSGGGPRPVPHPARCLVAIEPRHADIEQHDVGAEELRLLQGFDTVVSDTG